MTPEMRQTLDYLKLYAAQNRIMPSLREIAKHHGIALSGACRRVSGLVARGHVRRIPYRARGLEFDHGKTCPHCGGEL